MTSQDPKIYRVAELTRLLKAALEREFGNVWVEGEISNLRVPSSGHAYFTLKDETAQIGVVMWRSEVQRLPLPLADGLQVRVFGLVSVYERGGNYQIIARRIEQAGRGALYAAFEKLKAKLAAEGLFAAARKRPLPLLPRHIGIATSPSGAALRDILNILGRRFPNLHIVIAPTRVQGEEAGAEIAAALDRLNALGRLDVLIVARGGGSFEDLWCFNDERVVRAIARSPIPVISAVGHETDFTLSDFAADLRAPTPSAAAELVVARKADFAERLAQMALQLGKALRAAAAHSRQRLNAIRRSFVFREPRHVAQLGRERLAGLQRRARQALRLRWQETQQSVDELGLRLPRSLRALADRETQTIRRLDAQLRALNPLAVLERGYSLTQDERRAILRATAGMKSGQRVFTRLARGMFEAEVKQIHDEEKNG